MDALHNEREPLLPREGYTANTQPRGYVPSLSIPEDVPHDDIATQDLAPDGGFNAWFQVLLGHLIAANSYGFATSFGVFQSYYTLHNGMSLSQASLIGALQGWLFFLLGILSGYATDVGYFTQCLLIGSACQVSAMLLLSVSTSYPTILLTQGLLYGIGGGLSFTPSLAVVSSYFSRNRGFAICVQLLGAATGGMFWPPLLRFLLPRVGFVWTARILGIIMFMVLSFCVAFLKPRSNETKTGAKKVATKFSFAALKEWPFSLFMVGSFFTYWPAYFGFYFVAKYGQERLAMCEADSINLIMVMIGVGLPFRVLPGVIADRITGPLNLLIPACFITGASLYSWTLIRSSYGLYVFAASFGIGIASVQALFSPALVMLTPDPLELGMRLGLGNFFVSWAVLTGAPLAGVLVASGRSGYWWAQVWAGSSMCIGGCCILGARIVRSGIKLKVKT